MEFFWGGILQCRVLVAFTFLLHLLSLSNFILPFFKKNLMVASTHHRHSLK